MYDVDPCTELANAVREIFREGIELSRDVVEFIDSTYASPTTQDLRSILNAESDTDRDTLLELIFAPDEPFQERLEPILTRHRFSTEDEAKIFEMLCDPIPEATIIFPDFRRRLFVTPPQWVIDSLLSKLHITKQLPTLVADTVAHSVTKARQNQVRVRLRNMLGDLTEPQIDCLCQYLRTADATQAAFLTCLDFILPFLLGMGDTRDIYQSLMEHKLACRVQLERAMKQEKALAENNVETLLLGGERILHFDKNDLMRTIAAIDEIAMTVFGKTETMLHPESTTDLGDHIGRKDLERLIAFLSQS